MDTIETLLLLALPASGKSEVRKYLAHVDGATCRKDFHLGETLQLDDFPYVHLMRRVDETMIGAGKAPVFFKAPDQPFQSALEWGTLIELLNEDYDDLVAKKSVTAASAGNWILERFERAATKVGLPARLAKLEDGTRSKVAAVLEAEARELLEERNQRNSEDRTGRTVVIEFARGGPEGASMPLPEGYGYRYSLGRLSPKILEKASILYIWVTPEESRRKNRARANPDDPGSILHHGVPEVVMRGEYGCDDMDWLLAQSGRTGAVSVEAHGKRFTLPVGRFDNRVDKTSFLRDDAAAWRAEDVKAIHEGLRGALDAAHASRA